jgi:hypothetical protein
VDQQCAWASKPPPTSRWQGSAGSRCRAIQRVLFVGAERRDEFTHALRLADAGHDVMVVNPRETLPARLFRRAEGTFVRVRVEQLPAEHCQFDLICENYPYPSGRNYVPPRPFVVARLSRLAPCGRWILVTESARLAGLLKAAVDYDLSLQRRYSVAMEEVPTGQAPPSAYPPVSTRYRLVFQYCPT